MEIINSSLYMGSENIEDYLPKDIIKVTINKINSESDNNENQRIITIERVRI